MEFSKSVLDRFWKKVNKDGPIPKHMPHLGKCWLWTPGTVNKYGLFLYDGKNYNAHRFSWMVQFGEIPFGLLVCHHCDTCRCVNGQHLFLGTVKDNVADKDQKGRTPSGDLHWKRRRPDLVARGDRHPMAKLSASDVAEILRLLNLGNSCSSIAKIFPVSAGHIWQIKTGKRWKIPNGN